MIEAMRGRRPAAAPAAELLDGLFGPSRRLYKRVAQYSLFQSLPDLYQLLARRPYPWLVRCALKTLRPWRAPPLSRVVAPHEVLFDAPPVELEVEFQIEVAFPKENCYRKLGDISPVVKTLAREQFDDYVKRVRIFANPRVAADLRSLRQLPDLLAEAVSMTG